MDYSLYVDLRGPSTKGSLSAKGMFSAILSEEDEEVSMVGKGLQDFSSMVQYIFTRVSRFGDRNWKEKIKSIENQKIERKTKLETIEITFERLLILSKYYISPFKQPFIEWVNICSSTTFRNLET